MTNLLKIKDDETIKNVNYRNLKLYHYLNTDYMKLISVEDYLNQEYILILR